MNKGANIYKPFADFGNNIGADIAYDLLKWGVGALSRTKLGTIVRVRLGLLDEKTETQYQKIVTEAFVQYFNLYPNRRFDVIYDFFRNDLISKRLYDYIFDGVIINFGEVETEFREKVGRDYIFWNIMERRGLSIERLVQDFVDIYIEREKKVSGIETARIIRYLTEMEQRLLELSMANDEYSAAVPSSFEIESPPRIESFVGRNQELLYHTGQLNHKKLTFIEGMPGVGKTWLGTKVIELEESADTFWFTFRQGLNDTVEALIWEIAIFLAVNEETGLWQLLQDQIRYPVNVQLSHLSKILLKKPYFLCFDEIQVVQDNSQVQSFFSQLITILSSNAVQKTKLIFIGANKPSFLLMKTRQLRGLSKADTKLFLQKRNIAVSNEIIADLFRSTDGNPYYMNLFAQWHAIKSRSPTEMLDFITTISERESVRDYLHSKVANALSEDELSIFYLLSLLRKPVGHEILGCVLNTTKLVISLERFAHMHLIENTSKNYSLHGILRDYFYNLINPIQLKSTHKKLAKCLEIAGSFIEATHHYLQAGSFNQSVRVLTKNIALLVNTGRAVPTLDLLDKIPINDITENNIPGLYYAYGRAQRMSGQFSNAVKSFLKSEKKFREISDLDGQVEALCGIAETERMQGDYQKTLTVYKKAAKLAKLNKDNKNIGRALCGIGRACRLISNYSEAINYYTEADEIYFSSTDERGRAEAVWGRARTNIMLGNLDASMEGFLQAQEISKNIGDNYRNAEAIWGIGEAFRALGKYDDSLKTYLELLDVAKQLNSPPYGLAWTYIGLGETYRAIGDLDKAHDMLQEANHLCNDIGDNYGIATSTLGLAEVERARGDFDKALLLGNESLKIADKIMHRLDATHSMLLIEETRRLKNHAKPSKYTQILDQYEEIGSPWGVIHTLVGRALSDQRGTASDLNDALILAKKLKFHAEEKYINSIIANPDPKEMHPLIFP